MEKQKPHYDLKELKKLVKNDKTRLITYLSVQNAHKIGFSKTEIVETILSLDIGVFYKSMTSYGSHTLWQDVYKPSKKGLNLYVKIQKSKDGKCVVIDFKQDEEGGI